MSTGVNNAHQLSDIMAAFNIPDTEDLAQEFNPLDSASTTENEILGPPTPQISDSPMPQDTPVQGSSLHGTTLLDHIASLTSSSSFASLEQPSRRTSAGVKQMPPLGKQSLPPTHMHQQSTSCGPPFSSSNPLSLNMNSPPSPSDYRARTAAAEFRHQHEAAIEFDQLYDYSQPALVYSKEDWPSPNPEPDLQPSDVQDDTNMVSRLPESTDIGSCGDRGVSSDTKTGITRSVVGSRRSQRTRRQDHQLSTQQIYKPSTQYGRRNNSVSSIYSDSLRPFRSVMTEEHKALIAEGLSDSQMIEMLAELQELLREKQRNATRMRRACLSKEKIEEERRKNRERKRRSRQDPFKEFHRIMTDEQKELLLQPDLDSAVRDNIMAELIATKKMINRDETRKRRARMSAEEKDEERRKSREYKRRTQSDPVQAFKSVITEKHLEQLNQDLDEEQRESLVHELIELKKAKQRDDMRKRRARFSSEQKERERAYSREYMRMRRQRNGGARNATPRSVNISKNDIPVNERMHSMFLAEHVDVKTDLKPDLHKQADVVLDHGHSTTIVKNECLIQDNVDTFIGSEEYPPEYASLTKLEQERVRNKFRQRRRRAMQTEQEREEEKRKNRERTRRRRRQLAEIGKVVAKGKLRKLENVSQRGMDTGAHESMEGMSEGGSRKTRSKRPLRITPDTPSSSSQSSQSLGTTRQRASIPDKPMPWFTKQLSDEMKKRNRDRTRRKRANMTEEQREQERLRNRERQRIRRLMQTPEERAAYIERQRNIRRQQRRDPSYRERERERQRLRKKALRESPDYRAHENDMYHIRRARITITPVMTHGNGDFAESKERAGSSDAIQHHESGSMHSEDYVGLDEYTKMEKELSHKDIKNKIKVLHDESPDYDDDVKCMNEEESISDFEGIYQRANEGLEQNTKDELNMGAQEEKEDLKMKISSVLGLHKIVPLNK